MVLSMYVSMRGSSLIEYQLPKLTLTWIQKINKNSQEVQYNEGNCTSFFIAKKLICPFTTLPQPYHRNAV